jgi:E3 ubiquitin-protein ligase RNF1/2
MAAKFACFQFIALQLSRQAEELEMYIRVDRSHGNVVSKGSSSNEVKQRPFDGLERLGEDKLLSELHPSFASSNGDLVRPSLKINLPSLYACSLLPSDNTVPLCSIARS